MRYPRPLLAVLILPALGAEPCETDPTPDPTPTVEPRFAALSASLEVERESMGAPGLAFSYFEGDELLFSRGYGTKEPDGWERVSHSTLFRIGSVTKMMTATALLQHVEDGVVDLDDPITAYIPDLDFALDPTWADAITVRDLVDHTGAFYDYLELEGDPSDEALDTFLTGWFAENIPLLAPPGRLWNYSNPNFYLTGLITERITGRPYRLILDEDVLTPLGMDRTFLLPADVLADGDYASGISESWDGWTGEGPVVAPDSYDNGWVRPAGYAFSSVDDLSRFARFLLLGDARVLSEGAHAQLLTRQVDTQLVGSQLGYAMGLMVYDGFFVGSEFYDTTLITHGGDVPGFAADVFVLPDLGYGFTALASADGAHLNTSLVEAFEVGGLPEPSEAPDLSPLPETFPELVGSYVDPWNILGPMEVRLRQGNLTLEMPLLDQGNVPYTSRLLPSTIDNFLLVINGYPQTLTFIRDASGVPEYARTRIAVGWRAAEGRSWGDGASPRAPLDRDDLIRRLKEASDADGQALRFAPPAAREAWKAAGGR